MGGSFLGPRSPALCCSSIRPDGGTWVPGYKDRSRVPRWLERGTYRSWDEVPKYQGTQVLRPVRTDLRYIVPCTHVPAEPWAKRSRQGLAQGRFQCPGATRSPHKSPEVHPAPTSKALAALVSSQLPLFRPHWTSCAGASRSNSQRNTGKIQLGMYHHPPFSESRYLALPNHDDVNYIYVPSPSPPPSSIRPLLPPN